MEQLLKDAIEITKEYACIFSRKVPSFVQRDDMLHEAFVRTLGCLDRYDPEQGSLKTFLMPHVFGSIQDYLRKSDGYSKNNGKTHLISLTVSGSDNLETETHITDVPDPNANLGFQHISQGKISDLVKELSKHVPQRYWLVLVLYYREEKTMKEIGEFLGVNESRVSQMHDSALNRLSGVLYSMGIARLSQIID